MAKYYWLTRNDSIFATGKTPYKIEKLLGECQRRGNGKKKEYLIPFDCCTEEYKSKHIPVEIEDQRDDILDELEANVDFNEQDNSLNDQLKRVKIQKIKVDTKHLNQKLDFRKRQLFTEWSEKFFDVFADNFGKLRNCLINMRLNTEQMNTFNQTLDNCINNLELHLDDIWNQFQNEKNEVNDEKED